MTKKDRIFISKDGWHKHKRNYFLEELANTITHGIGAALSVAGLITLVIYAKLNSDSTAVLCSLIYGSSVVILYTASTLYHSVRRPNLKELFKLLDHSSIFIMIAGSYTPFCLITLADTWGYPLFYSAWGLAAAGILFKIFYINRFQMLSTVIYLVMSWLALVAAQQLFAALPTPALIGLFAGGFAYTIGVIFFVWESLPFGHAIWHLFVLTGSLCHYFTILNYVIQ